MKHYALFRPTGTRAAMPKIPVFGCENWVHTYVLNGSSNMDTQYQPYSLGHMRSTNPPEFRTMVIGPTPPGTGVIWDATLVASALELIHCSSH